MDRIFDGGDTPAGASAVAVAMPRITRRAFVGGAASVPLLHLPEGMAAPVPDVPGSTWELSLEILEEPGGHVLLVREIYQPPRGQSPVAWQHPHDKALDLPKAPVLRIPAAAFGPQAWFDMDRPLAPEPMPPNERPGHAGLLRVVHVRQAVFGHDAASRFSFEFRRPKASVGTSRWRVAFRTDLWVSMRERESSTLTSEAVLFEDFATKGARIGEILSSGRISRTMDRIFGGPLRLAPGSDGPARASIGCELVWEVRSLPSNPPVLSVIDEQIAIEAFEFSWRERTDSKERFFSGRALDPTVRPAKPLTPRRPITVGPSSGHHVELRGLDVSQVPWKVEIRVSPSPIRPEVLQTVAAVKIGEGLLNVRDGRRLIAGAIRAEALVLTSTLLPSLKAGRDGEASPARYRTVLWGATAPVTESAHAPVLEAWVGTTPVGALKIAPWPVDAQSAPPPRPEAHAAGAEQAAASRQSAGIAAAGDTGLAPSEDQQRLFVAATGDQGGAAGSTLYIVADRDPRKPLGVLRRASIDASLVASTLALPDVSFSRLEFKRSELRLHFEDGRRLTAAVFAEHPRPLARSYVWIGADRTRPGAPSADAVRAVLDLSGATLTCGRDYDLAKLRLSFRELEIVCPDAAPPYIRSVRADCRVLLRPNGELNDTRPVIIAEFDPQHVLEEAVFRPDAIDLPDIELEGAVDRAAMLALLGAVALGDRAARASLRRGWRAEKVAKGKGEDGARKAFDEFAGAFERAAAAAGLPEDQRIYIGPFALDPDAMAIARGVQRRQLADRLYQFITDLLVNVDTTILPKLKANSPGQGLLESIAGDAVNPASASPARGRALRNETVLERLEPLYGYFREHWRNEIVRVRSAGSNLSNEPDKRLQAAVLAFPMGWLDEYLSPGNRPAPLAEPAGKDGPAPAGPATTLLEAYALVRHLIKQSFVELVKGSGPLPDDGLMGARLSARSRLAFRINCSPAAGLSAEEAGLPDGSGNGPAARGSGSAMLPVMPFTFEALTDWSRHEPSVTRRAQRLYDALPSGVLPPVGDRAPNASDADILAFQRIPPGPVSGAQRMAQIRAALAVVPSASETAIEIPARLVLSTAQDAVWMTPRRLPDASALDARQCPGDPVKPGVLDDGAMVLRPGSPALYLPRRLWSARLFVDTLRPGVRAVASSDLRPMALDGLRPGSGPRLPGHGSPPRGPWAPWFLGPEQSDAGDLSPRDVSAQMTGTPIDDVCVKPEVLNPAAAQWRLVRWLCERVGLRKRLPLENYTLFRTSLDAYDRHQLVLLTSVYGLPVTGKRQSLDSEGEKSGALVADSGQVEPGDGYALLDGRSDQAIYRPEPLDVRELALTALGGSLLHDTTFKPAAGADDVYGNKIFEGFSIERWQHEIVLGRDIRSEVVYKGYLLPLGHRASLVKLTERIFLRTKTGGIKAILRQRMYVRIATPEKTYPAIGQPFEGRLWCGKSVTLRTVRTPDIIDPTTPLDGVPTELKPESLSGRIYLGGETGLAFWPRADLTRDGLVKFEVDIEGAACRMPMLFVDNIAATTEKALAAAANHYNSGKWPTPSAPTPADAQVSADFEKEMRRRRTIDLRGQTLQLADSAQPDDTRFEIDEFEIRVHGRNKNPFTSWTGPLDYYRTTGALEGAEQPPFYPRVHEFTLKLGRVARFSGMPIPPVVARYDGHYVRYGFPAKEPSAGTPPSNAEDNSAEVFLNFDQVVPLGMGGNGNRSAGIGRPESWMIGLGRKFGPVGGGEGEEIVWQRGPAHENPFLQQVVSRTTPKDAAVVQAPNFDASARRELVSLAYYLGWSNRMPGRAIAAQPAQPAAGASVPVGPAKEIQDPSILSRLQVLQSYLSGNAKVLGTIRIKDLLTLLDIEKLNFPALEEITEYGTALARQGETALENQLADLRQRVLQPLRAVVSRLKQQWDDVDASFKRRQFDAKAVLNGGQPLSLASIYPEIDAGLTTVRQALDAALKVDRIAELPAPMARLYEACKRLIAGLAALASHPVERLERALTDGLLSRVRSLEAILTDASKNFTAAQALQTILRGLSAQQLADWLMAQLDPSLTPQPSPFDVPDEQGFIAKNLGKPLGKAYDAVFKPSPDETWADALIPVAVPVPDLVAHARAWFDASVAPMPAAVEGAISPIARTLAISVREGSVDILRDVLSNAFVEGMRARGTKPGAQWVQDAVENATKALAARVKGAADSAADEAEKALGKLALAAEHDADALTGRLRADLETWAQKAREQLLGMVAEKVSGAPELVATFAGIRRIVDTVRKLDALLDAIDKGRPAGVLSSAASAIQDIVGIDVRAALQGSETAKKVGAANSLLAAYLSDVRAVAAAGFQATALSAPAMRKLRQELVACADYRSDKYGRLPPTARPCSTTLIDALASATDTLIEVGVRLDEVGNQLKKARKEISPHVDVDELVKRTDALIELVGRNDSNPSSLRRRFKDLLCEAIETTHALRCLVEAAALVPGNGVAAFNRDAFDRAAGQARALREAGNSMGTTLAAIVRLLNTLAPVAGAGLLGGAAAQVAQAAGIPKKWADLFDGLSSKLKDSESKLVSSLVAGINAACGLTCAFGSVSVAGVRTLSNALQEARGALDALGLDVEPQAAAVFASLEQLQQRIQQVETIRPVTIADLTSLTFDGVLRWATGPDQANVALTFGSTVGGNTFLSIATAARNSELASAAAWRALQARLEGVPERARRAVEAIMFRATADGGVLKQFQLFHAGLVQARAGIHEQLTSNVITLPLAGELLVPQVATYSSAPAKGDPLSVKNDRLVQEGEVLGALAGAAPAVTPAAELPAPLRKDLVLLLGSWLRGTAAPLFLLAKAGDVVKSVSRGDLLSVVDLGAFRDQLEDAIAAMIPTRRKLSYDFSSRVTREPNKNSLFQPKLGSEFSLRAVGTVDLLRPEKSFFEANGVIGPFSVKLVGGVVEAVELKFRGAGFAMAEGRKPRFDVAFDDFVIGPALEFVRKLEPLLSPKDGNGVFVQPMTRTAGIEAGFRINLPSIGLGATSFFNISLNVSAELPFDDSEGLFKVSLGRRLAPFSMSVLPFCGSGFFSIFCGADGIRGFEASFEFGAGGSLQFGPLLAQCRIQVGVYVSSLMLGDQRVTQIFGTFFAGGSATLWIFSFSTSLYVRLGQQSGGAMYGDAVYSFSFSLGFARYNYSVTAFHTEAPIGNGSGSQHAAAGSRGGSDATSVARAAPDERPGRHRDPGVLVASSDTDPSTYIRYLEKVAADSPRRSAAVPSRGKASARPAAASKSDAAFVSVARSQSQWSTYRQYFDEDLLKDMKGVLL